MLNLLFKIIKVLRLETPIMPSEIFPSDYYVDNETFDSLFPDTVRTLSQIHWTPLSVAKTAATFLALKPGSKILDIGSGVGKFCLAGAHYFPESEFYGVEQRLDLVHFAQIAKQVSEINNASFIHANFTQLNIEAFDGFYFYNSFGENLIDLISLEKSSEESTALYIYYSRYLCQALDSKAKGTRLVTFDSFEDEVPSSYELVEHHMQKLKMWIKR